MRLLNTKTGEFRWVHKPEEVRYAILSHVWSPEGEQSYAELLQLQAQVRAERAWLVPRTFEPDQRPPLPEDEVLRRASPKIRGACANAYALAEGFELLWIDSACIDKTNSVELSEAIKSMLRWYTRARAAVYYASLGDVRAARPARAPGPAVGPRAAEPLEELIAPRVLIFCGADWEMSTPKDHERRFGPPPPRA